MITTLDHSLKTADPAPASWWRRDLAAAALVFGATLIAYLPALRGGLIWDDDFHVTKPPLRSLHGLWLIWFRVGETPQYYPLLHSAFWAEHRLWGDAVLGYHLVNVLLHATSACLFGLVLRRLLVDRVVPNALVGAGGRTSALGTTRSALVSAPLLGALLFALHPVCVESVAWISEQKNTLSTVFYLLAALEFLTWHGLPAHVGNGHGLAGRGVAVSLARPVSAPLNAGPRRGSLLVAVATAETGSPCHAGWGRYVLALALFVLALLSKSVTATLPAALLVVIWWQRGRLSGKRDIAPLLPWLALGVASGLFTDWVERVSIRATGAEFSLSAVQRCLVAGRVIWFYLAKLAWPADLIFIYPRWVVDASAGWQYLFPLAAVGLAAALVTLCRRTRGPLAGVLLFGGALVPVLGFFNVYPFKYSFVADHFQYLATLGVFGLVAGGWGATLARLEARPAATAVRLWQAGAAIVVAGLGILTFRQCHMYRDAETLYRTTIERNPGCWMAYNNLGALMLERGRKAEAIAYYTKSLELKSDDAIPHNNLGLALSGVGRRREAIEQFQEALRLRPTYAEAHDNLGVALRRAGEIPESIAECEEALRLAPDYAAAHADLARALAAEGRSPEAIAEFEQALGIQPGNPEIHADLATALSQAGQLTAAIGEYEVALRLRPDYAEVDNNLGVALAEDNRLPEAIARLEDAVRVRPDYADAHDNLAAVLRAAGRNPEADAQAEAAARIRADRPPPQN